jgi:hypothetical protein
MEFATSCGGSHACWQNDPRRAGIAAIALAAQLLAPNLCRAQTGAIPPVELELGDTPEETYDLNALDFIEVRSNRFAIVGIPIVRHAVWVPVVGKYRYDLSYSDFFERVGEPELARKQRSINTWSTVLSLGGSIVMLVGIFMPMALRSNNEVTTTGLVLGGSLIVGGLVMCGTGNMIWRPVASANEAMVLAERYNMVLPERIRQGEADARVQQSVALPLSGAEWLGYQMHF